MPRNTTSLWIGLALAGALTASAAQAAERDLGPKSRATALQAVVDCRALTDSAARLACYDTAAAQLDAAEAKGDVVVIDRGQVREARRAAFGFNFQMPNFMTRGEKPEELDRITSTVASAKQDLRGKWVITLEDGAVWRQIDTTKLSRTPKKGAPVELRTATLGSYFLKIGDQERIRAHRDN